MTNSKFIGSLREYKELSKITSKNGGRISQYISDNITITDHTISREYNDPTETPAGVIAFSDQKIEDIVLGAIDNTDIKISFYAFNGCTIDKYNANLLIDIITNLYKKGIGNISLSINVGKEPNTLILKMSGCDIIEIFTPQGDTLLKSIKFGDADSNKDLVISILKHVSD